MPRKKAVVPQVLIKAWVSPELRAKMDLLLASELEGRVPYGEISAFIANRLREYFDFETLDLSLYGFPQGYFVRGPKAMVENLRLRLQFQETFDAKH